jgi:hypothetical protein
MELEYPGWVTEPDELLELCEANQTPIINILTKLTDETYSYACDLFDLVHSEIERKRNLRDKEPTTPTLRPDELKRRARELLVLLKGNDVYVYPIDNIKELPEQWELPRDGSAKNYEFQLIIAFGPPPPPDPDRETKVSILIDHGHPRYIIEDPALWIPKDRPAANSPSQEMPTPPE